MHNTIPVHPGSGYAAPGVGGLEALYCHTSAWVDLGTTWRYIWFAISRYFSYVMVISCNKSSFIVSVKQCPLGYLSSKCLQLLKNFKNINIYSIYKPVTSCSQFLNCRAALEQIKESNIDYHLKFQNI